MKFPFIIFFRYEQYSHADQFFTENKENLNCSVYITNNFKKIEKLHNANFHLLYFFVMTNIITLIIFLRKIKQNLIVVFI